MEDKQASIVLQAVGQVIEDMFDQKLAIKYPSQATNEPNLICYTIAVPDVPQVLIKLYARDDIKPVDRAPVGLLMDWIEKNGFFDDVVQGKIPVNNPSEDEFTAIFNGSSEPINDFIDKLYQFALELDVNSFYRQVDDGKGFIRNVLQKMSASVIEVLDEGEVDVRCRLMRFHRSRTLPIAPAPLLVSGSAMMAVAYLNDSDHADALRNARQHMEELFR